jgi:hypothetical protein
MFKGGDAAVDKVVVPDQDPLLLTFVNSPENDLGEDKERF